MYWSLVRFLGLGLMSPNCPDQRLLWPQTALVLPPPHSPPRLLSVRQVIGQEGPQLRVRKCGDLVQLILHHSKWL